MLILGHKVMIITETINGAFITHQPTHLARLNACCTTDRKFHLLCKSHDRIILTSKRTNLCTVSSLSIYLALSLSRGKCLFSVPPTFDHVYTHVFKCQTADANKQKITFKHKDESVPLFSIMLVYL